MEKHSARTQIKNPFRKEKCTVTNLRVTVPARLINFCHIKDGQPAQELLHADRVLLLPAATPGDDTCPIKKYTIKQKSPKPTPHINLVATYQLELRRDIKNVLPATVEIDWTWGETDDGAVFWRGEIALI